MFYAHFVLSKKGPLAKIWLAAHWDKKLTKAHVFETNIEGSVEAIIQPKAKLALRTSGHLLLGVVRIYSRKAKYLLADCNEAFVKIKMAFRPGMVDLPEENREAALSAITLPEAFHEFDTAMADLSDLEVQTQFAVNQSRPEEITMREDLGSITLIGDDGFGDMGFDSSLLDDSQLEETLFAREPADFATLAMLAMKENQETVPMETNEDEAVAASNMEEDNYEGPAGADDYDSNDGGHFSPAGDAELFTDSIGGEVEREVGGLFEDPLIHEESSGQPIQSEFPLPVAAPFLSPSHKQSLPTEPSAVFTLDPSMPQLDREAPIVNHASPPPLPLPSNEPETFTLKPVDVVATGPERKYRKKRKLVVDDQKAIASETMKLQLSDTSEIITTLDLAPPTKKLMHWKETGGVDKLTIFPCRPIVSKRLSKLFSSNLVMKHIPEKVQDSTLNDSRDEGQQEMKRSSDKIEVRNTVGADGMPRLVFAVKKNLIQPTPTEETPHHQQSIDDSSAFKVPSPPPPPCNESPLRKESLVSPAPPGSTPRHVKETSIDELPVDTTLDPFVRSTPGRTPLYDKQPGLVVTNNNNNYDDDDDNDMGGAYDGYDDDDYQGANNEMEVDYQDHNGDEAQRKVEEEENEDEEVDDDDDAQTTVEGEEMTEEAEENRWNKKSQQVLHSFNRLINKKDQVGFKEMLTKCNRKQVASKFYSLLVLKKTQMIDVYQPEPYSDVILTRGPSYAKLAG